MADTDEPLTDDGEFTTGNGQANHICPKCKAHYSKASDANSCCSG
jgi:hypothetical protein